MQNIANTLSYDSPVKRFRHNGNTGTIYSLTFRSKSFFNSLKSLGGTSKKSLTMQFPQMPKIFLVDFIRGYFDGDGSVYLVSYARTKDHHRQIDLRSNFTSGSYRFLFQLRNILTKLPGLSSKKISAYVNKKYPTNKSWRLGYGTKDTLKLLKFIYYPSCALYLERKFAIYQKYLNISK